MSASIGLGKIILLGEHAVVYGYPALAAALDRGVAVGAVPTPAGGTLRVEIAAWDLKVSVTDEHPVAQAMVALADELGLGRPSITLVGDAQIPPGAGLGSSAALAVAAARALLVRTRGKADPASVARAASASEHVMHGRASGIDVALALGGGIGVFRKSTGLRSFACSALRVLVGPSGASRSTAAMVERVAHETQSRVDDARLRELGGLTDTGAEALVAGALPDLGAAMDRAHAILADLGVSTGQLDELCSTARAAGAYGAKLTGAGGGGAVIAIAPREHEAAILSAWKRAGVTGFVTVVGGGAA